MNRKTLVGVAGLLAVTLLGVAGVSAAEKSNTDPKNQLPRPDGKPADMKKPVKVFILLGQSNMVGMGKIAGGEGSLENAVKAKKKYPYLVDAEGKWTAQQDGSRGVTIKEFTLTPVK